MALPRVKPVLNRLLCLTSLIAAVGCSSQQNVRNPGESLITEKIPLYDTAPPQSYKAPEFVPVTEDIVPLKTKIVNIVVRNSSLGDVLHVLAEAGGLNLLVDRDVALDQQVTLSLRNVTAQEALKSIFSSVDYFYTLQGNTLKVESVATRVFELGHPALVNSYSMDVGGDILGGAMVTAGGGSGSSNLKGAITSGSKADVKAHDFWESLEKSLDNLLGKKEATATARAADPRNQPVNQGQPGQAGSQQSAQNISERITGTASAGQSGSGQGQQSITVNRLTGTIMVTASRKGMERVERYLENVRKVLSRQVMIEARIIEVQLNEGLNFGIDWSFLKNIRGWGGAVGAGFTAVDFAATNAATMARAGTSNFQVGVTKGDFNSLLTALKTQGSVKTLSNPKVNVMNGHASILTVGRNTSYISKVTSTTATSSGSTPLTTFNVETGSILSGLIIGIVPYISDSGEISLNVTPITSDLVKLDEKSVGSIGNQTFISIPTVDLREMTTTVKMQDGQLVIIGGLISKKSVTDDEKIPVIGDIPGLGKLFTRTRNNESRSELVLLLRPHIINGD